MAPKKDTTVTPIRKRLPRAAKDKPNELPKSIPKTTPKTIKKTAGHLKKSIPAEVSTPTESLARDVKEKEKEIARPTPEVPSDPVTNDEIIRQEATYPNPFSTENSRRNTAALLSQWDSTKSPIFSPESEKRLANETPKSTSQWSAKSKHERACSTLNKAHIAIPPPASKDRGEETSQLFEANKQNRLNSLAEGRFPDPTYPRASISDGTEPSPGFNAAMGFRYSPGFGGPHGFNMSAGNQFGFSPARNSSTVPGTGDLLSSEQTKRADPTDPGSDTGPSSHVEGVEFRTSPSKQAFTGPVQLPPEYVRNYLTDCSNYLKLIEERLTGQDQTSFGPYGFSLGPGNVPRYYNPETRSYVNIPSWTYPQIPDFSWMLQYASMPYVPPFPDIEDERPSQPEQAAQLSTVENPSVAENLEPLGIKESRMTREKTLFVPGGKIIKTTTTVFTPADEEKRKGKNVEGVPEDKVGIVVVDKEGNVEVESGDWLAGFNRIEGWEVDALLHESRRWRPHKNRNGGTKRGIAKKPLLKKATAPTKDSTSPKDQPNTSKFTTRSHEIPPVSLEFGTIQVPEPTTWHDSGLDFIPFDFPHIPGMRSTRSQAKRISKATPQTLQRGPAFKAKPAKRATPAQKASTSQRKPAPKVTPANGKAATNKTVKPTSASARSLRSTSSPTAPPKSKPSPSASHSTPNPKSQPKANTTKQNVSKPGTTNPLTGFTHNTAELERQVQRQLALADQAAENIERRRGRAAERAAKDFETLMGFVEWGRKELERRRNRGNS